MATVPATASENDDFVSKKVNVTFLPGEAGTKSVQFDIVDDLLVEPTEQFEVAVVSSSVSAVTWGDPVAVNILDNDGKYYRKFCDDQSNYKVLLENMRRCLG